MRWTVISTQIVLSCLVAIVLCTSQSFGQRKIEMETSAKKVGKYEKLELLIRVDAGYDNPFDPNQVDLTVLLKTPGDEQFTVHIDGCPPPHCKNRFPARQKEDDDARSHYGHGPRQ